MELREQPVIVLMTDFGLDDTFVGQMKGVILSIAPHARIIDLTHAVSPQNIAQGAFILGKSVPFFPDGSIVVAVVDPGVGTSRCAIAVETAKHIYVAPDNGLLAAVFLQEDVKSCVRITETRFMLPSSSTTFHGRDLFSPVAAHLASGVAVSGLGCAIAPGACTMISLPACTLSDDGRTMEGVVIYADHFGNLVTSIEAEMLDEPERWEVVFGNAYRLPLSLTYGSTAEGKPLAYRGSSGTIEIAVRNGNGAKTLGLKPGEPVMLKKR